MNKKFLSLVLALVMVLGAFTSVLAADEEDDVIAVPKLASNEQKIQWLQDNGIVVGRKVNEDPEDNDLALDENIMRSEVTKLLVYAVGQQDLADKIKGTYKPFDDVDNTHWANGFISVAATEASEANGIPFINGYPDGTFKPSDDVTYAELAKMLVVLADEELTEAIHDDINENNWPAGWLARAAKLGILDGVTVDDSDAAAPRNDAFVMIYNAFYKLETLDKKLANDDIGIVSDLNADELTLNQGSFTKKFKVLPSTNLVSNDRWDRDYLEDRTQGARIVVTVDEVGNSISNFFYGSLVRVIYNADGELSHIVELGNPDELACVYNNGELEGRQWADLADSVINASPRVRFPSWNVTPEGEEPTLLQDAVSADITIAPEGDRISFRGFLADPTAEGLAVDPSGLFYQTGNIIPIEGAANPEETELDITDNTRIFVADWANDKLTEVEDIHEAIRLAGYNTLTDIPEVYAGWQDVNDPEATVLVFNRLISATPETLRVKTEAGSNFELVLENTKGEEKKVDLSQLQYRWPLNYDAENFDVVSVQFWRDEVVINNQIIEHNNTDDFPIVKVVDLDTDNRVVRLEDEDGFTQEFYYERDNDTFLEGQLKEGAVVQYKRVGNPVTDIWATDPADNNRQVIDVFSILPAQTKLEGQLPKGIATNRFDADLVEVEDPADGTPTYGNLYKLTVENVTDNQGKVSREARDLAITEEDATLINFVNNSKQFAESVQFRIDIQDRVGGEYDKADLVGIVDDNNNVTTKAELKEIYKAAVAAQKDVDDAAKALTTQPADLGVQVVDPMDDDTAKTVAEAATKAAIDDANGSAIDVNYDAKLVKGEVDNDAELEYEVTISKDGADQDRVVKVKMVAVTEEQAPVSLTAKNIENMEKPEVELDTNSKTDLKDKLESEDYLENSKIKQDGVKITVTVPDDVTLEADQDVTVQVLVEPDPADENVNSKTINLVVTPTGF